VAEELEAGAAEHLPFEHFRFRVDAFRAPVVMRERKRGGGRVVGREVAACLGHFPIHRLEPHTLEADD
jgi:hypothetical protein